MPSMASVNSCVRGCSWFEHEPRCRRRAVRNFLPVVQFQEPEVRGAPHQEPLVSTRRVAANFSCFSPYVVGRSHTGNGKLLLPLQFAAQLLEEQIERARASEAEFQAKEERRREVASARISSVTPSPQRTRLIGSRSSKRSNSKWRIATTAAGTQYFEPRSATRHRSGQHVLHDKDYQKRELDLTKKMERIGALRDIANPAFRPAKWAKVSTLELLPERHGAMHHRCHEPERRSWPGQCRLELLPCGTPGW